MAIVGIYSYPKSGNTWVRAIIAAAMGTSAKSIPDLHEQPLTDAKEFRGFRFFKHHSGHNIEKWNNIPIATTHIIHIMRNPLDVFVSYLNFISANVTNTGNIPFDNVESIVGTDLMDLYFNTFVTIGHIAPRMYNLTNDYFSHNRYWLDYNCKPIAHLKYEDLLQNPVETLEFLKSWINITDDDIRNMLETAGLNTNKNGKFYWKQQEKNYFNYLTEKQISLFLKYRGDECRSLGYDPEYLASAP